MTDISDDETRPHDNVSPHGPVRSGTCLCGATRYEVAGPLEEAAICHCRMCRRATGSALNVSVPVDADCVTWEAREKLTEYESSPGKMRAFCGGCGAAVYSRHTAHPGALRLRIGLLEAMNEVPNLYHIYWADRLGWMDRFGSLPQNSAEEPGRS